MSTRAFNLGELKVDDNSQLAIGTNTGDFYNVGGTVSTFKAESGHQVLNLVGNLEENSYLQFGSETVRRASVHTANGSDLVVTVNAANSGTTLSERFRVANDRVSVSADKFKISTGTADPSSPQTGDMYYNTTDSIVKVYDGSNWVAVSYTPFEATGGDIVYEDGIYNVHIFTSSGTFVMPSEHRLDVLIVGGGGGGGVSLAGGGGGGGVAYASNYLASAGTYTITVGGGGAGGTSTADPGNNGGSSSAFGQTVTGGQGGRSRYQDGASWPTGANGGGGANDSSNVSGGSGSKPTAIAGFTTYGGFNGGSTSGAVGSNNYPGAGGAGAGANGQSVSSTSAAGGNGGSGAGPFDITGTSYYWAGGGGGSSYQGSNGGGNGGAGGGGGGSANSGSGGTGGTGYNTGGNGLSGGGDGNANQSGGAGGANTGGGAGAANHEGNNPNGIGGSGIVVIRYAR